MRKRSCWLMFLLLIAAGSATRPAVTTVLLTADAEGHIGPCRSCPSERGYGGIARRASVIGAEREKDANLLLLEAGNFLAGAETVDDNGATYAAACQAMKYDAVNVSYRDLRFGREASLKSLAVLPAVSANLQDAATGKPLLPAYVVVQHGGQRVAVIGASEPPPDMPHLKQPLAGLKFADPAAAVLAALPQAQAVADRVIVLYYGPADALDTFRQKLAGQSVTIFAGGTQADGVHGGGRPAVAVEDIHGKYIARAVLAADGGVTIEQLPITPNIPPDDRIARMVEPK